MTENLREPDGRDFHAANDREAEERDGFSNEKPYTTLEPDDVGRCRSPEPPWLALLMRWQFNTCGGTIAVGSVTFRG